MHQSAAAADTVSPAPPPSALQARLLLGLLVAVYTCNFVDRYIMALLLEPLRHEFDLSDSQLGLMSNLAYGLAYAVAGVPMGLLVDRISRKKLITVTLALWSGLTALAAGVNSFTAMLFVRAGVGAAESAAAPASYSLIGDSFPRERRATAAGIFFIASPLGLFISFAGGGLIVDSLGWRAAFLIAGLPGILLALVVWLVMREPARGAYEPPRADGRSHEAAPLGETLRYLLQERLLLVLTAAMVLIAMAAASMTVWTASYFVRIHDMALTDVGLLVATLGGLGIVVGSSGSGWLADRIGRGDRRWHLWLSAVAALLALASGLLMTFAVTLPIAALGMFLYKGLAAGHIGPTFATSINSAPIAMRGTIISIQQVMLNFVGFGFGPLITGLISDAFGGGDALRPAIAATLAINIPAALLLLVAANMVGRRDKATAES